ncbi:SusC/RagA family TonB-linked outer membrane protein [Mucilaginibacter sp. FT3.2]|uniref:SusC/RagA family TonB-linked outer membrane protein n=1 Tax=Mucilaginibacter sp. FT3.2 TaxID=2723090 RepID=UPI00182D084C|nr:TonB-dependent receptor [Mucilaginibacter sp. FT3.2]MBB6233620.1 TonB-linked SusC/RagA family outer membrane protein [Mucilaginibacter sp. FT3.2]
MIINSPNKFPILKRLTKVSLLCILMVAFTTLLFAGPISGQTIANTRISVVLQNASLKTALAQAEQKSGFIFVYNERLLNPYGNFTIVKDKISVAELLRILLDKTDLTYQEKDKKVLIVQKEHPKPVIRQPVISAVVSGQVLDEKGLGLPGVTVKVKNASLNTATDAAGNYKIAVNDNNAILIFSFVGYQTQEVVINGREVINIQLSVSAGQLDAVVVVGYGTQKKTSLTSAVSQISGNTLVQRPVSNVQQSLQGLAPGVTVLDRGGSPGRSSATIRVRGITTFNINSSSTGGYDLSKNDALVIVDGIEQKLTDINPDDIDNVSILKDAASTAIYGSRATNGVILITTKRAKENKLSINYNYYYASQNAINKPEMMGLEAYMRLEQVAYINAGAALPARFTDESINTWVNATDREKYPLPNTWFQTMLHSAPQQNHSISVAGGDDKIKARLSARYMTQDGIVVNFKDQIKEVKLNTDYTAAKILKFSGDLNYRSNYSTVPTVDPFNNFYHGSLWAVPKYADGTYGLSTQGNNPLMFAEIGGLSSQYDDNLIANLKAELEILPGLKLSTQYGARVEYIQQKNFTNAYSNTDKNTNITKTVANNSLTEVRNNLREYTWNNLLTYDKVIGKHAFKALAGYSEIYNTQSYLSAYRERFYNNDVESIGQGANDGTKSNSGYDANFGLRSYFGRLNYAYNDKYLFEANGRYDGSSKFTGNKRYGFFPSFSAGWRVSQESFWENLKGSVSDLKLRGSWGKTGNQSVDLYSYYSALALTTYTFGGASVPGYRQSTLANTDLGWESTTQLDLGLDASFLNNHLSVTADYYRKVTNNILLNLGIPATVGLAAPAQNAGSVENKGFEFSVAYHGGESAFRYNVSANLTINQNKVLDLKGTGPYITGSDIDPRYIVKVGLPVNTLWGYKTDGLFQTQAQVNSYPTYAANSKPGDVKYVDLNKDGKIDANDMTAIGNPFPKYTFGLSSDLAYKNFDLNFLFQGAAKVDTRLSGALAEMGNQEGFTSAIYTNNYWTPENTGARFPRPVKFDLRNVATSDRLIINGSYLRLKNIQLGYSLPKEIASKLRLSRIRLYVSATNLLTFSKLNEWKLDPEVESGRATYYPQTSLYTAGVNVQF